MHLISDHIAQRTAKMQTKHSIAELLINAFAFTLSSPHPLEIQRVFMITSAPTSVYRAYICNVQNFHAVPCMQWEISFTAPSENNEPRSPTEMSLSLMNQIYRAFAGCYCTLEWQRCAAVCGQFAGTHLCMNPGTRTKRDRL